MAKKSTTPATPATLADALKNFSVAEMTDADVAALEAKLQERKMATHHFHLTVEVTGLATAEALTKVLQEQGYEVTLSDAEAVHTTTTTSSKKKSSTKAAPKTKSWIDWGDEVTKAYKALKVKLGSKAAAYEAMCKGQGVPAGTKFQMIDGIARRIQ